MRRIFGHHDHQDIEEVTLTSAAGVSVAILTRGALIRDWRVPVNGVKRPVVLGFEQLGPYLDESPYFGEITGRVANRIAGARFDLGGIEHVLVANEGANQLHGGPRGIGKQNWTIADLGPDHVTLTLSSPDGEMGFPGKLDISVTYRLKAYRLDIEVTAETSAPTPVNIVQHNYFDLSGQADIRDHRLWLAASAFTEVDQELIPTGAILPVAGGPLDFRTPRPLRDADGAGVSIDHNFVLDTGRHWDGPVAVLEAPDGALTLKLFSDQPGLQVYTSGALAVQSPGLDGLCYRQFSGICLEDQCFPDAVHQRHFPNTILSPGLPYTHRCAIEIKPAGGA